MNPLLIALLGIMLLPLFTASWRLSLMGLVGQGLVMAWIAYREHPTMPDVDAWLELVDLAVVRGLFAPIALYAGLRALRTTPRHDMLPPNLMTWTVAVVVVLAAFRFSDLVGDLSIDEHAFVSVATAALLLGLLQLSTQVGTFSQILGLVRIQNAIALFELGIHAEVEPGIRIVQTAIFAGTLLLARWFLVTIPSAKPTAHDAAGLDG
jgi:hydrogenase-4 membrane subunit HyfE